jgi:hypothetical protein
VGVRLAGVRLAGVVKTDVRRSAVAARLAG